MSIERSVYRDIKQTISSKQTALCHLGPRLVKDMATDPGTYQVGVAVNWELISYKGE